MESRRLRDPEQPLRNGGLVDHEKTTRTPLETAGHSRQASTWTTSCVTPSVLRGAWCRPWKVCLNLHSSI